MGAAEWGIDGGGGRGGTAGGNVMGKIGSHSRGRC